MAVEPAYSLACDPLYEQLAQIVWSLQNRSMVSRHMSAPWGGRQSL